MSIATSLFSDSQIRLLPWLFGQPERSYHLSELRRLTALGVNQVLGGAVFLMPALVFSQLGNWSMWAVASVGLLSMCIALCLQKVRIRQAAPCMWSQKRLMQGRWWCKSDAVY